ncbi:alpha/beta hydrolase [Pseudoneobacillus rhizosphaerae]|uniref:Hydrolase MhqD n=1 Tax=Pseudoneobacillus rhizosphaerae TaxID=2880968 RepID=A0A9C7G6A1_9BACI|nr:alpha/beta hydrolase [Pseudoneobacillus rhizosphaerae]CAG9606475.1 Putative hydrolase MhqD [Pseudoneobacillus rhizosphaerae]
MKHFYQKGTDSTKPTLLLLHGTGGNEMDLIPLASKIDEDCSILSIRGNVLENGMPRFFKRLAEGVFDEADLVFRTKELYEFLDEAAKKYDFDRSNIVALGYSNGANIAGSLLFHYQNALRGAMLLHPMVPRRGVEMPDLTNIPVYISAGANDPICPPEETKELHTILESAHADVQVHWENYGHQLTYSELEAARVWYQKNLS